MEGWQDAELQCLPSRAPGRGSVRRLRPGAIALLVTATLRSDAAVMQA